MNLVDLAVLVVIALSAIFAFARGFVREVLSIAAWIGAALITLYGFNAVYGLTARFVTTPMLADLIAGAGLFLVSLIVLTILTGYLAGFMRWSALTPVDRTLGLIFGVVRGAVLVSIAYFLVDITLPPNDRPSWFLDARSQPLLTEGANMVRGVLPASLQLKSASTLEDTQRALGQAKAARDAMGALSSPAVAIPPKPQEAPVTSYKPADQRELNRLIDNSH
ncbi:MAG: CvpA family protein [Alphaproteobacteria bacterium]|nr:CvpA family protein [Alphaproteobacteria bacterium]